MAKTCPITNDVVLYLDCLECDEKKCQGEGGKKKEGEKGTEGEE